MHFESAPCKANEIRQRREGGVNAALGRAVVSFKQLSTLGWSTSAVNGLIGSDGDQGGLTVNY